MLEWNTKVSVSAHGLAQGDPGSVDKYLQKRLQGYEIHSIMKLTRAEILPTTYGLLHYFLDASANVERSFWNSLLAKDRNFLLHNVKNV